MIAGRPSFLAMLMLLLSIFAIVFLQNAVTSLTARRSQEGFANKSCPSMCEPQYADYLLPFP